MIIQDHLYRDVEVNVPAKRIISLCPSITETLFAIGAGDRVVGRTRFCIHPSPDVLNAMNVGGTKDLHMQRIASLQPDLILAEKEENTKPMVDSLESLYPVFVNEVKNVEDAFRMIEDVGIMAGKSEQSRQLVDLIRTQIPTCHEGPIISYAYVIWKNPDMAVGQDTFIDDLLSKFGFKNVLSELPGRYPVFSMQTLRDLKPDVVFLSSEPYPFAINDRNFYATNLPGVEIILIDGEIAWYGSRMTKSVRILEDVRKTLDQNRVFNKQ